MRKSKHQLTKRQSAVLLGMFPFAATGALYGIKYLYARFLMPHMPPCLLRTFTGWRCPSCGMTHSVFALARLDVIGALRENVMIPFAALTAVIWYIELWIRWSGSQRRIIPRSKRFWVGVLIFWGVYTVARNLI